MAGLDFQGGDGLWIANGPDDHFAPGDSGGPIVCRGVDKRWYDVATCTFTKTWLNKVVSFSEKTGFQLDRIRAAIQQVQARD
jgi:hypothetical protein